MRTTLTLDTDVYQAARGIAHRKGEALGKVVSDLARRGLAEPVMPIRRHPLSGLPYVEVPAGTPPMSADAIQRYLDEEGSF